MKNVSRQGNQSYYDVAMFKPPHGLRHTCRIAIIFHASFKVYAYLKFANILETLLFHEHFNIL
jgi:hypothetical protein